MEYLVQQIAELLSITIAQATELYPVLRSQFIAYKVIQSFLLMIQIAAVASAAVVGVAGPLGIIVELERELIEKVMKLGFLVFIIAVAAYILATLALYLLAPDIALIKEFL